MIKLKDYQKSAVEFLKNNFGLILFHSTGSGKTITSLSCMSQFPNDILVIGNKSSKKAFMDEIKKLNIDSKKITIYSYQKIKSIMYEEIDLFLNKCVIIDEAHHLRNATKNNIYLLDMLISSYKVILLTATPVVNYLNDISPLINLVKRDEVLPTDKKLFDYFYFNEDSLEMINKDELKNKIKNAISYYKIKDYNIFYPSKKEKLIKIEMSPEQVHEYKRYIRTIFYKNDSKSIPTTDISGITHINFETLGKREKNFFLQSTRQLSNTIDNDHNSPKIRKLYKKITSLPYPAIVYSNYLKNGIYPIAKWLYNKNISYKVISGTTTPDKLIKIVDDYNKRLFNVLLISSAGSESLDLKNTRQIHIMEPHWNEAKILQIIGRAVRYKSHFNLPKKEQNVSIYRWISIFPKPINNPSADEYLMEVSKKKKEIFNSFKQIIIESSIKH